MLRRIGGRVDQMELHRSSGAGLGSEVNRQQLPLGQNRNIAARPSGLHHPRRVDDQVDEVVTRLSGVGTETRRAAVSATDVLDNDLER